MGRQKNTPKKRDTEIDTKYLDYIPVKKRKRNQNVKPEKNYNILLTTEKSKQFYLGELLLGPTNNIFPLEYKTVKVSFRFSKHNEFESTEDNNLVDSIVIDCEGVLVIVKSYSDTEFIKELVSQKAFSFDFFLKEDNVYLKIFFTTLPLPKFYPKIGNTTKTLFSILFGKTLLVDSSSESLHKKYHGGNEIDNLYDKINKKRKEHIFSWNENIQHPSLRPKLRPYQEKSVQWMLNREKMEEHDMFPEQLHPLYTQIKLDSNVVIYFDKYTGYVTSEKPLVSPTSKGGILADEMGLGKTVELLACILLNPKKHMIKNSEKPDTDKELTPVKKQETGIEDSDTDTEITPVKKLKRRIDDSEDEDFSVAKVTKCIEGSEDEENSKKYCTDMEITTAKKVRRRVEDFDESDSDAEIISVKKVKKRNEDSGYGAKVRKYITNSESSKKITPLIKKQKKRQRIAANSQNNDSVDEPKTLKVPQDWVKESKKKSSTKIALEMWYNSILSDLSTIKHDPYKDPNRISVQCICGGTSEDKTIKCTKCPKHQHKQCLGYKKSLGKYLCPQCWMDEPLLESGATLIVTPAALKTQWCKEICRHIKGDLRVLQYEGSSATPVYPTTLKDYDIVLTTYSVLQNELRLTENGQVFNLRKERKYSPPGSILTRLKWWRLCLDEAQTVDAPGRMVSEMAGKIDSVYRWAVTGTPISKNISDLHGLIDYLHITPYNDLMTWNKILYEPYLNGNEEALINFLTTILWRTTKKDVTDQINIPKQTHLQHMLEFSAVEKYFYKREHELICSDFLSKVTKFDLSLHLESLDRRTLKKLLAPLLTLRHACTYPNTVRGRYLATKKQVTSMRELLDALILKNTNDSEDRLRLIISSLNGLAGIHLLLQDPQEAINCYRQVLQLASRFSQDKGEAKLTIDKPQVIHTLHNLAEVLDLHPPDQPTLRDGHLRKDCEDLEQKYMGKFISECTSAFESFSGIMLNIEKMQNQFVLKDGQWYSDGLDWIFVKGHFEDLKSKIMTACDNANVDNNSRNPAQRTLLQLMYDWDNDISLLRSNLFESIENLYDYQADDVHKIVVKPDLVGKAMNCHLRPQKKSKKSAKCPVCIANDHLKKYEEKLFLMVKRKKTFEEMSLLGSWKPTLQELVFRSVLATLRAKNADKNFKADGELHLNIIENLKKEFKELRRLWTFLDQQICAKDELDICKVRLQLKTDTEEAKQNPTLKNLNYILENKLETINLLSIHELDYQMSSLENDAKQNSLMLEKMLGTQSYLETLRKQQYEGQSPDPCPICKNTLEQHWSILLCGHSYCLECIQILLEQTAGDHIQCSICRNKQKYQEISYIKAGNTVTDDDTKNIKGNYSTKIEAVIKLLVDLKNENPDVKVLLFSSWVTVLNCLKKALDNNSIASELAHSGNLDAKITNFKDGSKKITAFLLPVNLGSKGLNLVEATHVILVEPLLNPADELQAIGRVNRIGQTKATYVHKFLIKNTIEESIHQATTSNAENWEKSRVTLQHLVDLFDNVEIIEEDIGNNSTDRGQILSSDDREMTSSNEAEAFISDEIHTTRDAPTSAPGCSEESRNYRKTEGNESS